MMRKLLVLVVGLVGVVMLLAAAHHFLVVAAGGDGDLGDWARGTCSYCHGDEYGTPATPGE